MWVLTERGKRYKEQLMDGLFRLDPPPGPLRQTNKKLKLSTLVYVDESGMIPENSGELLVFTILQNQGCFERVD